MAVLLSPEEFTKPRWCILLALCCGLHNVHGRSGQYAPDKKSTFYQTVDVHLLCYNIPFRQLFRSDSNRHLHVLSWCGDWDRYIRVLGRDCQHRRQAVVVVSRTAWEYVRPKSSKLRERECSHVRWVHIKEGPGSKSTGKHTANQEPLLRAAINKLPQRSKASDPVALAKQGPANRTQSWAILAGQPVSMGCVALNKTRVGESCLSLYGNTLAQALETINGTYKIIPIKRGTFAKVLRRKEVDIVVNSIGITYDRYQLFPFTVNKFGQAVYYVKKKWNHQADLFIGVLPWIPLLALSMLLSAGSIIFLNMRRGNRPTNGLGDVVLALTATTLAFSSPLGNDHARCPLSRLVLASWLLACLSLVIYTRSLLTASLMAGPSWNADDSLGEILPKLQSGLLLPCAEANSFFDHALTGALRNGTGVVNVMALATRRSGRSRRDFTGTFQSCVERTKKGTHLFFTNNMDYCRYLQFQKVIARGQKPVYTLVGGFPVRRDFALLSELISLVHRIFETGWEIRIKKLAQSNCSGFVENQELPRPGTAFMRIYYLFCALSIAVFFLEVLFSRLQMRGRSRWPIQRIAINPTPNNSAWVQASQRRS